MDEFKKSKENLIIIIMKLISFIIISVLIIVGVCIGTYVFINLSNFLLHENFLKLLTGSEAVMVSNQPKKIITKDELEALKLLVNNGRILTQDQFLGVVSSFYNSIINTLTVVISLLGVLAYFSIRSLSKSHAEQIVEKHTSKEIGYYLSDEENVKKLLNKNMLIRDLTYNQQEKINDEQQMRKKMAQLEERLLGIEFGLMGSKPESNNGNLVEEEIAHGDNEKK